MSAEAAPFEIRDRIREASESHRQGRLADAERLYREALAASPGDPDALHLLGVLTAQRGDLLRAADLIGQAISADPSNAAAYYNRGNVLSSLKRFDEAVSSYDSALCLRRDHQGALTNRGAALFALNRLEEALASHERALALDPNSAVLHFNRANALRDLGRLEEAVAGYGRALALAPRQSGAFNNRGGAFLRMRRFAAALADYDRALAIDPTDADAVYNRANLLVLMGRWGDALAAYERALVLRPGFGAARQGRGNAFLAMGDYEGAFAEYDAAFRLDPNLDYLEGSRLHAKMHICAWSDLADEMTRLARHVREAKRATEPFMLLPTTASAEEQLLCARIYAADKYRPSRRPVWNGETYRHGKVRLAYMSGEFREQATAYLTADLFECHDRNAFELHALATGDNDGSAMRKRLEAAFDVFADMSGRSDSEIAEFVRAREIDILINLNGYFGLDRTGVFAMRPSPVQVNYLGFPGTMGAPYMDYILADRHVIPEDQQRYYSEKVVYLPHSYQPNDRKKAASERIFTRAECGLPENGAVFCCFNNTHKIVPEIFGIWMRLIARVEQSVLWLLEGNAAVKRNIQNEAARRGISPGRIVFAPMMRLGDHLAREALADIFLDTLPHNAHTTASDALWCGVPVVTCPGSTFAGRVASSLLHAAGMPELIAASLEDYEALALKLARDADFLGAVKAKLARNRMTQPLFDTKAFTRDIESAYRTMWERAERGLPPAGFAVEAGPR